MSIELKAYETFIEGYILGSYGNNYKSDINILKIILEEERKHFHYLGEYYSEQEAFDYYYEYYINYQNELKNEYSFFDKVKVAFKNFFENPNEGDGLGLLIDSSLEDSAKYSAEDSIKRIKDISFSNLTEYYSLLDFELKTNPKVIKLFVKNCNPDYLVDLYKNFKSSCNKHLINEYSTSFVFGENKEIFKIFLDNCPLDKCELLLRESYLEEDKSINKLVLEKVKNLKKENTEISINENKKEIVEINKTKNDSDIADVSFQLSVPNTEYKHLSKKSIDFIKGSNGIGVNVYYNFENFNIETNYSLREYNKKVKNILKKLDEYRYSSFHIFEDFKDLENCFKQNPKIVEKTLRKIEKDDLLELYVSLDERTKKNLKLLQIALDKCDRYSVTKLYKIIPFELKNDKRVFDMFFEKVPDYEESFLLNHLFEQKSDLINNIDFFRSFFSTCDVTRIPEFFEIINKENPLLQNKVIDIVFKRYPIENIPTLIAKMNIDLQREYINILFEKRFIDDLPVNFSKIHPSLQKEYLEKALDNCNNVPYLVSRLNPDLLEDSDCLIKIFEKNNNINILKNIFVYCDKDEIAELFTNIDIFEKNNIEEVISYCSPRNIPKLFESVGDFNKELRDNYIDKFFMHCSSEKIPELFKLLDSKELQDKYIDVALNKCDKFVFVEFLKSIQTSNISLFNELIEDFNNNPKKLLKLFELRLVSDEERYKTDLENFNFLGEISPKLQKNDEVICKIFNNNKPHYTLDFFEELSKIDKDLALHKINYISKDISVTNLVKLFELIGDIDSSTQGNFCSKFIQKISTDYFPNFINNCNKENFSTLFEALENFNKNLFYDYANFSYIKPDFKDFYIEQKLKTLETSQIIDFYEKIDSKFKRDAEFICILAEKCPSEKFPELCEKFNSGQINVLIEHIKSKKNTNNCENFSYIKNKYKESFVETESNQEIIENTKNKSEEILGLDK